MNRQYQFRNIRKEEIPQMFRLIQERMKWMDEKGIRQWNATDYDKAYPLSYYEDRRRRGEVFILQEAAGGQMVCAAVLSGEDARWPDGAPALYVHNFVSKIGEPGAGRIFMGQAEAYGLRLGKKYLRLDSAKDNPALSRYYESLGFQAAGTCREGLYEGILRQKRLRGPGLPLGN